jgi:hypothetical protein
MCKLMKYTLFYNSLYVNYTSIKLVKKENNLCILKLGYIHNIYIHTYAFGRFLFSQSSGKIVACIEMSSWYPYSQPSKIRLCPIDKVKLKHKILH